MSSYSVASWAATIFVLGAAVYIYRPDLIKKAFPSGENGSEQNVVPSKPAAKKQKPKKTQASKPSAAEATGSAATSSSEMRAAKKRKITPPVVGTVTATTLDGQKRELPRSEDNNITDQEFAQQLSKAQTGTKYQSTSQQKSSKTQKQGASAESPVKSSTKVGLPEQDADEDSSSPQSLPRASVSGTNVSDMLEAPSAKPTSIRLTNITEEKKPQQAKQQFEQVQSKKKRNEQARREEQKRLREESDRVHEAKKQEQLRRARMAEGSSNQSKANAFHSKMNVWQANNQSEIKQPPATTSAPLLDTFEPQNNIDSSEGAVQSKPLSHIMDHPPQSNTATELRNKVGLGKAGALSASTREQAPQTTWADEMSEEEQMQKLREQEQEDAWEPVTSKKGKKKTRQESDSMSETSSSQQPQRTTAASKLGTNGTKLNGTSKPSETSNRFDFIKANGNGGLEDDEWQA